MTRKIQSNNTSGISGLRFLYQSSKGGELKPYVQASWHDGRVCCTNYSVEKHGPIEATRLAMKAREERSGQVINLSPRAAWRRIKQRSNAYDQTV